MLSLAIVSMIDGYLLSAISLVGRAGINLFYTQYVFLKTWWKGASLVFIVWMILFAIMTLLQKKLTRGASTIVQVVFIMIAVTGLYLSYLDFRNALSHRWLGERFHLGAYLFWLGWIAISVFVLLTKQPGLENVPAKNSEFKNVEL